ncbi:unnamed protein product [Symbiodinium sp. CCMP2592]|nr:unnamed protein product [Symbiodinium sp. CCMP2592]
MLTVKVIFMLTVMTLIVMRVVMIKCSALYLMLLFFLHRDYNLVSQLVNSVATDSPYTSEDAVCFEHFESIDDRHPNATALRCKLALAVQHSRMPLPWALYEEGAEHVRRVIHVTGECRLSFEEEMQVLTMCRHYREKLLLVTREVDALRRDQGQMLKKFKSMLEDEGEMLTASGEHAKSLKKWKDRIVRRLRAERLGTGDKELVALILAALRGVRLDPEDVLMLQNREKYMDAMEEKRSSVTLSMMPMPR